MALALIAAPAIARGQIVSSTGGGSSVTIVTAPQPEPPDMWELRSTADVAKQIEAYLPTLTGLQFPSPLAQVQREAEQDAKARAADDSLISYVKARLTKADPEYGSPPEDSLLHQMQMAHAIGDSATLLQLAGPVQKIENARRAAWVRVIQDPEVRKRVDAYRKMVVAKMTEIDPTAPIQIKWVQVNPHLNDLHQRLARVQRQAEQDPMVQRSANAYEKTVLAKMAEIDSATPKLIKWLEMLQAGQPSTSARPEVTLSLPTAVPPRLGQAAAQDPKVQAAVDSLMAIR